MGGVYPAHTYNMNTFLLLIKDNWKKALLYSCFFLAIYYALYYISIADYGSFGSDVRAAEEEQKADQFNRKFGSSANSDTLNSAEWAKKYKVDQKELKPAEDADRDGLPNAIEFLHNTDPNNPDTDGDNYTDRQEVINGYDPDAPGDARPVVDISIPTAQVSSIPVVWSRSEEEKDMEKDLENGVIHFAHTASPGQIGNMVLSGHSSNYVWAKGNYNHVFKNLNGANKGDEITVKVAQANGKVITYKYVVTDKKTAGPNDQGIFEETERPTMTLTTCWPIGSNSQRLVIKAELQKNK